MFASPEGGALMKRWIVLAVMMMLAGPALADPTADARGVEEAFARACGAGDVKGVMALYADDAIAVWPGQGAEAKGKADIEKMAAALCRERGGAQFALKSLPLGDAHIVTVAHWEGTMPGPGGRRITTEVRSTEVLVKKDGAWRYLVDHASVGTPRPRAGPRRAASDARARSGKRWTERRLF